MRSYFVAKYLGPADYGLLQSIDLIQKLNKYGSLGLKPVAQREIGHAIGKEDYEQADYLRNVIYSFEIILSLLLLIIGCISILFITSSQVSILVLIASTGLFLTKINGIFSTEGIIQKNYKLLAYSSMIIGIITAILVIIFVPYLKIYAVLLSGIIDSISSILILKKTVKFQYKFLFNIKELKKILPISLPFVFINLSNGSLVYAERILLLKFIGSVALGFYGFGTMVVSNIVILLKSAIKVRKQDLYEFLAKKKYVGVHKIVLKETGLLLLVSFAAIPLFWFVLEYLIPLILPKWHDGISYFQIILFTLPLQLADNYAVAILNSKLINKQVLVSAVRLSGTLSLLILCFLVNYYSLLTLSKFIYIAIISYSIFYLPIISFYYTLFYKKYVIKNQ